MEAIDWGALSRLAPEIALVVIFGIFVLRLLDRQDKRDNRRDMLYEDRERSRNAISDARDETRDQHETARDAAYLASLEKRDLEWQRFMERQELSHAKAILRSVDEIEKLGHLVTATNTLIVQHDTWARSQSENSMRRTNMHTRKDD